MEKTRKNVEHWIESAYEYFHNEDFGQALIYFRKAIAALSAMDENTEELGILWRDLGVVYHQVNDLDEAIHCYTRSMSILMGSEDRLTEKQFRLWYWTGTAWFDKNNDDKAFLYYKRLVDQNLIDNEEYFPWISDCYKKMGQILVRQGANEQAQEILQKCLDAEQGFYGEQSEQAVETMLCISRLSKTQGLMQQAMDYLRRAMAMTGAMFGEQSPQYRELAEERRNLEKESH